MALRSAVPRRGARLLWNVLSQCVTALPASGSSTGGRTEPGLSGGSNVESGAHVGVNSKWAQGSNTIGEILHARKASSPCLQLLSHILPNAEVRTNAAASCHKPQFLTTRSYHSRGACLQKLDVIIPPPERKRMQETGDRNVDIFDREVKKKHRDRAAMTVPLQDPLLDHVTDSLLDRLEDIKRDFPVALSLGGAGDSVRRHLRGRGNIKTLYQMDLSQTMLDRSEDALNEDFPPESLFNPTLEAPSTSDPASKPSSPPSSDTDASESPSTSGRPEIFYVVGDEEQLPFREESLDLVVSSLGLHWVNDLPGAMIQARRALKPDGLFLAAMFGGETLKELRIACSVAELEREGGVSPRVSPLVQVRDAGNLLGRANLALPAVDVDTFTVNYPSALELVEHLRSIGEVNAVRNRRLVLPRDTALATAAAYQSMFANEDGSVPATFQVIYMAGWAPHNTQQRPRQRGSATVSLEDLAQVVDWRPEGSEPK